MRCAQPAWHRRRPRSCRVPSGTGRSHSAPESPYVRKNDPSCRPGLGDSVERQRYRGPLAWTFRTTARTGYPHTVHSSSVSAYRSSDCTLRGGTTAPRETDCEDGSRDSLPPNLFARTARLIASAPQRFVCTNPRFGHSGPASAASARSFRDPGRQAADSTSLTLRPGPSNGRPCRLFSGTRQIAAATARPAHGSAAIPPRRAMQRFACGHR